MISYGSAKLLTAPKAPTIREIDERIRNLWATVTTWRTTGEAAVSPVTCLQIIDDLLDQRHDTVIA